MKQLIIMIAVLWIATTCSAGVTVFNNYNFPLQAREAWFNAAGPITTIDVTGFAANTIITNQYTYLGVTFTDGTDRIHYSGSYLEDGVGLNGAFDDSRLEFSQPMNTLAFDYPGTIQFVLYYRSQVVYDSDIVWGLAQAHLLVWSPPRRLMPYRSLIHSLGWYTTRSISAHRFPHRRRCSRSQPA